MPTIKNLLKVLLKLSSTAKTRPYLLLHPNFLHFWLIHLPDLVRLVQRPLHLFLDPFHFLLQLFCQVLRFV